MKKLKMGLLLIASHIGLFMMGTLVSIDLRFSQGGIYVGKFITAKYGASSAHKELNDQANLSLYGIFTLYDGILQNESPVEARRELQEVAILMRNYANRLLEKTGPPPVESF